MASEMRVSDVLNRHLLYEHEFSVVLGALLGGYIGSHANFDIRTTWDFLYALLSLICLLSVIAGFRLIACFLASGNFRFTFYAIAGHAPYAVIFLYLFDHLFVGHKPFVALILVCWLISYLLSGLNTYMYSDA